jgi:DNA (cytosine-5)-methyltransferase 1
MIRTGSDFSGVGAFPQALNRLNIDYDEIFSCDLDKYARQTYIHNYGEPAYYPENVYDREIPEQPLDIYMTSPPCQAFSLAGKRKGETDKRGILFYNSHEFIKKNKPRYFIFENVKGLLSDEQGKTFQNWIDMLAGKTVNGNPVIFPHEESTPYHVYYKVLNAKDFGVPQNRERIFIIGIRDDADNNFRFPKPFPLVKRLKDVLETEVEEKYFLSDKMVSGFVNKPTPGFENRFKPLDKNAINANTITTNNGSNISDNFIKDSGYINQDTQASQVHSKEKEAPTLSAGTHGYANGYVQIGAMRGRNPENPSDRTTGAPTEQRLEINSQGISNTLTSVQKDNLVLSDKIRRLTPRECFRLMDFPDSFSWSVSDTQAYKQAGNSIVVNVLAQIIKNLNL